MGAEERLSKRIYKGELFMIKLLPMIMAGLYFLNTVLSYFYMDYEIISYVSGIGILPLLFLYLTSYCFGFCSYHRVPLHYIICNDVICWADSYYELPLSNLEYLSLHCIAAFMCICLFTYLRLRVCKRH